MKLVEILAKELGEWPEGYRAIVQTSKALTLPVDTRKVEWVWRQWDYVDVSVDIYNAQFECSELADDHATAIVTREMWQAERERAVTGQGASGDAGAKDWRLTESPSLHCQSVERVSRGGDPRTIRDRIREIDATIEAMTSERAELVSKLAGEGFALIVQTAEPVEDMSDWRNWKVGDLVVRETFSDESSMPIAKEMAITAFDDSENGQNIEIDKYYWPLVSTLRWHSRPSA